MDHFLKAISLILITFFLSLTSCSSGSEGGTEILVSPRLGKFEVKVTATGELQAKNSVSIFGPQGATKANIYQAKISDLLPEGTKVKKGDYVARVDDSDLTTKIMDAQIALQKAESQFTQAKLDTALSLSEARNKIVNLKFSMEEKLAEIEQSAYEAPATKQKVKLEFERAQLAYDQEIDNYQKRIAQSVAKVKESETELIKQQRKYNDFVALRSEFTIMAPDDGMIIYRRHWNGKKIAAGSMWERWNPVIATLPDLTKMQSITYINEIDIQKIKKDQEVTVRLDAMAEKSLIGKVTSLANIGEQRPNSDSKVFEVIIEISDEDSTLRPAMTTSNEILVAAKNESLFIPLECLHAQDSISYVFIDQGGNIARQEIKAGLINENDVEILNGLSTEHKVFLSMPGDTSGLSLLRIEPSKIAGN
ncbi:MAG: efflux RND transporter periplasmic adaptor subunit [Bacteroidota bacterium]